MSLKKTKLSNNRVESRQLRRHVTGPQLRPRYALLPVKSRPALGPTHPSIQWACEIPSLKYGRRVVKLNTHLHLLRG